MRGERMSGCTESTNNGTIYKLGRKVSNAYEKLRSHFDYDNYNIQMARRILMP